MPKKARFIMTLIAVYAIFLMAAKCPSSGEFEKAYNTVAGADTAIEVAADNMGALFLAHAITYEFKENAIKLLRQSKAKVDTFKASVDVLYAAYGNRIPQDKLAELDIVFSQVVGPVTQILEEAGVLPPNIAQQVRMAISVARQIILSVAAFFGKVRGTHVSESFHLAFQGREAYAE